MMIDLGWDTMIELGWGMKVDLGLCWGRFFW